MPAPRRPLPPFLWRGPVPSQSRARAGREYLVTVWADGRAECTCYDYLYQGKRGPLGPNHRCGHIKIAIAQQGLTIPDLPTEAAPAVEPSPPAPPPEEEAGGLFDDNFFERVVRRPSNERIDR